MFFDVSYSFFLRNSNPMSASLKNSGIFLHSRSKVNFKVKYDFSTNEARNKCNTLILCDFDWAIHFYPSAIKAVGYSDHQRRRSGRRAVRNSALTKKLTDELCLFFTDMTYVPGQFIPFIFFGTKP